MQSYNCMGLVQNTHFEDSSGVNGSLSPWQMSTLHSFPWLSLAVVEFLQMFIFLYIFSYICIYFYVYFHIFVCFCIYFWICSYKIDRLMSGGRLRRPRLLTISFIWTNPFFFSHTKNKMMSETVRHDITSSKSLMASSIQASIQHNKIFFRDKP